MTRGGCRRRCDNIRHLLHGLPHRQRARLGQNIADAKVYHNDKVILSPEKPLSQAGVSFVLRGNLAPDGCVIKPTCAEERLLGHTGPALVFKDYPDLKARIDDDKLPVTPDSVLVLQNGGLEARPHAGVGHATHPRKLLRQGVRHGPRLRRPHERHQLRHLRPARLPRKPPSAGRSRSCATGT